MVIDKDYHFQCSWKGVFLKMSSQLRFAVENRKRHLIDELIGAGVFKIRDRQLYELSLEELEKEYEDMEEYADIQA